MRISRTSAALAEHEPNTSSAFESDVAGSDAARLVKHAIAGNGWAWEGLIDKYGRLIWSITKEFRLVESDAADVFQTTWMRLIEHIDRLDRPDRVGSWLAATARNECLRCLASRKRLVLAPEEIAFNGRPRTSPTSTRPCSPTSVPRSSVRPWLICPGGGNDCWSC